MKHLIIPLLLAGSFVALSVTDASAVVCARGVYHAGCPPHAGPPSSHGLSPFPLHAVLLSCQGGSLFAAG